MNVCDLEEEKRERSLDNNSYVSDQDMCFRKKGRREKTRSDRIFGKRKSDFEMGGPVFIGDKKVAVAGGEVPDEPKNNSGSSSSSLSEFDDEVQDVYSDEKNKSDAEVAKKQAGNEQPS
ncbi:hypothetical protein Tco_0296512 [Tanacetum coccineum]